MPYMPWQNRMMSYFSSLSLVPVLVTLPMLSCRTNGIRWMLGGFSRQGSGDSVLEVEQSHSSNLVANKLLGSNAVYFLTFHFRRPGRYPSRLFGPGPISSAEILIRELKREA